MHPNEQKRALNWWLKEASYIAYVIREISGLMIAPYIILQIILLTASTSGIIPPPLSLNLSLPLGIIAFIGAVIHSLTWIGVMPLIFPIDLTKRSRAIVTIMLILIWLLISYLIFTII